MKHEWLKGIMFNDTKRGKMKTLCLYFDRKDYRKYPGISIRPDVNLMDEVFFLNSGVTLTTLSALIDEYESKIRRVK